MTDEPGDDDPDDEREGTPAPAQGTAAPPETTIDPPAGDAATRDEAAERDVAVEPERAPAETSDLRRVRALRAAPRPADSAPSFETVLGTADEETFELPGSMDTAALPRGTTIGTHVVLAKLGEDALGPIYSAFDVEGSRKVALRLLPVPTDDPESAERQLAVADIVAAVARVSHPGLLAVYDVGTWQGGVYVAMESFDGIDLASWIEARDEPFPWREVVRVFRDVGRAIAAAHAHGVLHRDFTPEKVLMGPAGHLKVVDFSLAPTAIDGPDDAVDEVQRLRKQLGLGDDEVPRVVLGTIEYAAPEVLAGAESDARSDQFSFCVALYEALYGERPFAASARNALAGEMVEGKLRATPAESRVPPWLREVVLRGLAIAPGERWPSVERLLRELDRDPAASRRRWQRGLAAVAVLSAMAGAATWWVDRTQQRCTSTGTELEGVWDGRRRAELARVFDSRQSAYADDNFRAVADAIDSWAGVWSHLQVEACEATRVRGEASEELYAERRACMAVRLDELGALLAVLESVDAAGLERALAAAESLTSTRVCTRASGLRELAQGGDADPEHVADIGARLDRAQLLLALGRDAAVDSSLPGIARDAEGLAHPALLVRLSRIRGATALAQGRTDDAVAAFHDAALRASQNGLDQALALAWIDLAGALARGREPARLAEATRTLDHARDLVDRVRFDEARWRLAAVAGDSAASAGKAADALARYHEALVQLESMPASSMARIELLLRLGDHVAPRDLAAAKGYVERAFELARDRLGPQHPLVAEPLVRLGRLQLAGDGGAEARATWERALAILAQAHGHDAELVRTLLTMARALRDRGEHDAALEYDRRAYVAAERVAPSDRELHAAVLLDQGRSLLALGRDTDAREPLQRAFELQQSLLGELGAGAAGDTRRIAAQRVIEAGGLLARALSSQPDLAPTAQALARKLRTLSSEHHVELDPWLVGVATAREGAAP